VTEDPTLDMIRDKVLLVDPWYQLVMEMLQLITHDFNGRKIIEVGCGVGGFLVNAARKGAFVVGLDISLNAIHIAKDLVKQYDLCDKVSLVIGDAQFLPFKDQIGDIVVCSETLEHVPDYSKAFSELVRITKSSCYLCVTVPNFLSTAVFENIILLLVGQPGYVKSKVAVEREHVFHIFKLRKLLNQHDDIEVITMRSVNFLHAPPRLRRFLKVDWVLKAISNKLENFFTSHFPFLRLTGANIGFLAKKR
jgi:2-polyprenyl-3-methyl-5-hydroxy-6-metoxy-1,4-benzoquinol methylase